MKLRGRKQMFLHLCLSIFTTCLNGRSHLPSCFFPGGGSSMLPVALTKAGTKAMGVHVLFTTHMRHSKTKHIPKQESGRGNNPPMTQSPSLSVSGHRGAGDIPVRHVSPEDEQGKDMHFCLDFPTLAVVPHGCLGTLTTLLSTCPAQAHLSHKHHSVPSLAYTTATLVSHSQCSALHLIAKLLLKLKKIKKIKKAKKAERGLETEQQRSPRAPVQRDTAGAGTGSPPRLHGREATKPSL